MPVKLGYIDTSIGQIHYRSAGTSGPVVVLLHQRASTRPEQVLSLTVIGGLAMGDAERAHWLEHIHPAPITPDGAHFTSAWHRVANIDAVPVLSPPDPELQHREAVDVLIASPRWPE